MKILALSDVHGDKAFIREMAQKGAEEKVDLVILAGDLGHFDQLPSGLIGPFKEKGLEVAILPGNHEGLAEVNFLAEKYSLKNLHGYTIKKDGLGIFGCGYADIGPHQISDEDIFKTLKQAHDSLGNVKKKLMVTHVQPSRTILSLGVKHWGSEGVRKAIAELQPDLHICGHVHETQGIEEMIGKTRVINVGKTGRIIEI